MKRQKGFAGMELLLLLGAFLLVCGIGAYLYGRRHRAATTAISPTTVKAVTGTSTSPGGIPGGASSSSGANAGSASSGGSSNLTVFKIPEVGMQISVPPSLAGLTYHVSSAASGTTSITFSTKSLSAAVPTCSADHGTGAFDTITRGNGTYQAPANAASGGLLKQYSGYYFAYLLPTGPCAKGMSTDNQALLDEQAQDFYAALPTVQAL